MAGTKATPTFAGTQAQQDEARVVRSLEADQLTAARMKHYPRRKLKRREAALLWSLRIYLVFMMGVVIYQIWTSVH